MDQSSSPTPNADIGNNSNYIRVIPSQTQVHPLSISHEPSSPTTIDTQSTVQENISTTHVVPTIPNTAPTSSSTTSPTNGARNVFNHTPTTAASPETDTSTLLNHQEYIMANPVQVFREQTRIGAIFYTFRWCFALAQVVTSITLLAIYQDQECSSVHKIWLISHTLLLVMVLLFCPRYFSLRSPVGGDPLLIQQEVVRKRLVGQLDSIFFLPFLMGNIAVFHARSCNLAIKIYTEVTVILNYVYICSPLIILTLALLFSPCLFYIYVRRMRREAEQRRIENGATDELIETIPIVTFVRRKLDETMSRRASLRQHFTEDVEQGLPLPQPPSLPHPVKGKHADSPTQDMKNDIPSNTVEATSTLTGLQPPTTSQTPPSGRRRRFRLLSSLFRSKDKTHASNTDDGQPSTHQVSSTASEKKYLELDDDDAVCVICLASYEEGESLRQLNCKHHFHVNCIDDWLRLNAKCPLCIQSIKKDAQTSSSSGPSNE